MKTLKNLLQKTLLPLTLTSLLTAPALAHTSDLQIRCVSGEAGFGTMDIKLSRVPDVDAGHGFTHLETDITRYDMKGKRVETRHQDAHDREDASDEEFSSRLDLISSAIYLRVPASKIDWQPTNTDCYSRSVSPGTWISLDLKSGQVKEAPIFITGELNPNHTWISVPGSFYSIQHPVVAGRVCPEVAPSVRARQPMTCKYITAPSL